MKSVLVKSVRVEEERSSYAQRMHCAFALLCLLPVCLMQPAEAQTTTSQPTNPAQIQSSQGVDSQSQTENDFDRTLGGTVTDQDGALIPGARVTLHSAGQTRSTVTDATGKFNFSHMAAGPYSLTIKAKGMESRTESGTLNEDESLDLPPIALTASVSDEVVVSGLSQHQLAEVQMKQQEQQRVLGAFPNFYVSYVWNAAPLSPGQKFRLAIRSIFDPTTFIIAAGIAGFEQETNQFSGYGGGWEGYGKRYGAELATRSISRMLGAAILPTVLHQDPRYFYLGTGTIRHRTWYAISRAVIQRGDNGKWQPAYSSILGSFGSGAISNLYYPASNRAGAGLTIENGSLGIAFDAMENLMEEFVLRKFTTGWKHHPAPAQP